MEDASSVTGSQIRAARALLGISAQDLAVRAKLSRGTIQRAENGTTEITAGNLARVIETLEKLGIRFLESNGEGPGVRLRQRHN